MVKIMVPNPIEQMDDLGGCIHSTSKAQLLPFGNVQVAAAAAPVAPDTTKQQSHAGLIALAGQKKCFPGRCGRFGSSKIDSWRLNQQKLYDLTWGYLVCFLRMAISYRDICRLSI